jgi:hypothetical protein
MLLQLLYLHLLPQLNVVEPSHLDVTTPNPSYCIF